MGSSKSKILSTTLNSNGGYETIKISSVKRTKPKKNYAVFIGEPACIRYTFDFTYCECYEDFSRKVELPYTQHAYILWYLQTVEIIEWYCYMKCLN